MLAEMFWTFLVGTIAGLSFGLVKACLKSRCEDVQFGCIRIHRNIQAEEEEHKFDIQNNVKGTGQFDL